MLLFASELSILQKWHYTLNIDEEIMCVKIVSHFFLEDILSPWNYKVQFDVFVKIELFT